MQAAISAACQSTRLQLLITWQGQLDLQSQPWQQASKDGQTGEVLTWNSCARMGSTLVLGGALGAGCLGGPASPYTLLQHALPG